MFGADERCRAMTTTFRRTATGGGASRGGRPVTVSTSDARQGITGHHVSLGVAAFVLAVVYYFFFAS
jgi:hypothetical protein